MLVNKLDPYGVNAHAHLCLPFILDKQEDLIQLIQLALGVVRRDADRDQHYILQHCNENRRACVRTLTASTVSINLSAPAVERQTSFTLSTRDSHLPIQRDVAIASVHSSSMSQDNTTPNPARSPVLRGLKCRIYGSLAKASGSSAWLSSY